MVHHIIGTWYFTLISLHNDRIESSISGVYHDFALLHWSCRPAAALNIHFCCCCVYWLMIGSCVDLMVNSVQYRDDGKSRYPTEGRQKAIANSPLITQYCTETLAATDTIRLTTMQPDRTGRTTATRTTSTGRAINIAELVVAASLTASHKYAVVD